jgi:hypothetical protein
MVGWERRLLTSSFVAARNGQVGVALDAGTPNGLKVDPMFARCGFSAFELEGEPMFARCGFSLFRGDGNIMASRLDVGGCPDITTGPGEGKLPSSRVVLSVSGQSFEQGDRRLRNALLLHLPQRRLRRRRRSYSGVNTTRHPFTITYIR